MPHTGPDYGLGTVKEIGFALDDMGELAARLGSIVTFDRRGDVVWFDDFEDGKHKWANSGTSGFASDWVTGKSRSGGFCYQLKPGTGDNGNGQMLHYQPLSVVGRAGFEISWTHTVDHKYVEIELTFHDGATSHKAVIRYNDVDDTMEYWPASGGWTVFQSGIAINHSHNVFNTFKMVADFASDEYIRAMLNDTETSLAGIAMRTAASGLGPYVLVKLALVSGVSSPGVAYQDDAIITQNEP
jgi:hypothetical protein